MYYLRLLTLEGKYYSYPDEYYTLKEAQGYGKALVLSGSYLGYQVIKKAKSIWD